MAALTHPSPNYNDRPGGVAIDMVILHYTGMRSGEAALARLCETAAQVSAHYLIDEDGTCHSLVDEEKRAWHAGVSSWKGTTNLNDQSIGIEIVNPGHEWGYTVFPAAQIEAVISLLQDIQQRRHIKPTMVLGHSDVAPDRKEDPGEKFPWDRLATERLAIGTFQGGFDASGEDALSYSEAILSLRDIGYDVPDNQHAAAVLAFQRRFCPAALGQGINPLTKAAIEWAKRKFTP
ncbi:MAG: N-acetylmuramoyl-L-alanine amidase [Pseudomonadota bacterium]